MFSSCRLLRYVCSPKSKSNRAGVYCLQSLTTGHVHTQFLSQETPENIPLEKVEAITEVFRDIRMTLIIWKKQRNNKVFTGFLNKCFRKKIVSPTYAVNLLRVSCDTAASCSADLVFNIMITFSNYIQDNGIEFHPSTAEKTEAFKFALNCRNFHLLQLVCNVFKINETDNYLKEFVDGLVLDKKLIEAAYCIAALNLQNEYAVEKIAIPLLLDGNLYPVISCLSNHPELQLKVAKTLDNLLVIKKTDSHNYESFLNSKKAFKVLNSMINIFNISPEPLINLCYIRGRAAINLLIKRRAEQSVTEGAWEDMVMSVLGDYPNLKEHLIYKLLLKNDKETALKMIEKLDMQDFDIASVQVKPEAVENMDKMDDLVEMTDEKAEVVEDPGHLSFPLSTSDIKFIDTEEKFTNFIKDISENYDMLGFDSEWKPHFGLSKDRLSLIQLGVHDKVYILDMLSLNECLTADHWDKLMDDIFGNPKIIKLACGIMGDVQMIVQNNKGTKGKAIRFSHILDMSLFYDKLQETYPEHMNFEPSRDKNRKGLSTLCEIFLGKRLNKEERLCDWDKRPLTESQLGYAALDAYCLLQIYEKLKCMAAEKDMNFGHLQKVAMHLTTGLWKPKKKLKGVKNEKDLHIHKPIPIQQFKVAVDPLLEVQGKELRKLGADVLILNESDSPETAVQISKSEKRILICSKALWKQVQNEVSSESCFKSHSGFEDTSSIPHILQRFNVVLNIKNILTRCTICNSEEYVRLSPKDLNLLQKTINKTWTEPDPDEGSSSFQKTLYDMVQSGISVKFNNQNDISQSGKSHTFLCKKCGTIQ